MKIPSSGNYRRAFFMERPNYAFKRRITMRKCAILVLLISLMCLSIAGYLAGCGGGGGESGAIAPTTSTTTGSVAVIISDGPADEYESICIKITEVSLIPVEGDGDQDHPVIIFQSEGEEVDLLTLYDEDFVLTVNSSVTAGEYEKVRIQISDIRATGGPCEQLEVMLPSGKIDLNPGEPFSVEADTTLLIRLDIDANKSMNLHTAGNSGKCIFRPVVFVEIATSTERCTSILTGTITELIKIDDEVEDFVVALSGGRGDLQVKLEEATVIFDNSGTRIDPSSLKNDLKVTLKGKIDSEGALHATFVVVGNGEVLVINGEVSDPVDEYGHFFFTVDEGEELSGQWEIEIDATQSLILVGCDTERGPEAILEGLRAQVVGRLNNGLVHAMVVLLELEEITGKLMSMEPTEHGTVLVISQEDETELEVFLPDGTPIYLEGDGALSSEFLCEGREVRVVIDPEAYEVLTAANLYLQSEKFTGVVEERDVASRTLTVDGITVSMQTTATILDTRGDEDTLISLNEIQVGDQVECFGITACSAEGSFVAFVVVLS
jgi:hypothetical protein